MWTNCAKSLGAAVIFLEQFGSQALQQRTVDAHPHYRFACGIAVLLYDLVSAEQCSMLVTLKSASYCAKDESEGTVACVIDSRSASRSGVCVYRRSVVQSARPWGRVKAGRRSWDGINGLRGMAPPALPFLLRRVVVA
jgi:hypothetical protein